MHTHTDLQVVCSRERERTAKVTQGGKKGWKVERTKEMHSGRMMERRSKTIKEKRKEMGHEWEKTRQEEKEEIIYNCF